MAGSFLKTPWRMIFWRVFAAAAAILLLIASRFLCEWAFQQVLDFRELERIPLSRITESVGGETQVRGRVDTTGGTLKAPRTGYQTLYYRYLVERKETDSDGNTTWRTVTDTRDVVDFSVSDDSGDA